MTAAWAELLTDPAVVAAAASLSGALGIGVLLGRLRQRLAAMEGERERLCAGLAALETRLGESDHRIHSSAAALRTDLAGIVESLAVAQREVEAQAAAARAAEQAEQTDALAALDRRLRAIEARLPALDRPEAERRRLDRLDTALTDAAATLSARLDAVEGGASDLEDRIAGLAAALATGDERLGALAEADASLAGRLESLEASVPAGAAWPETSPPSGTAAAASPVLQDLEARFARLEARQQQDRTFLADRLDALALAIDALAGDSTASARHGAPVAGEPDLAMPDRVISVLRA